MEPDELGVASSCEATGRGAVEGAPGGMGGRGGDEEARGLVMLTSLDI
jgi:hypothetical protein